MSDQETTAEEENKDPQETESDSLADLQELDKIKQELVGLPELCLNSMKKMELLNYQWQMWPEAELLLALLWLAKNQFI